MGEVVKLESRRVTTDEYFGGCPHCGQTNGFLNLGRDHWFICDRHKTKWWSGSNIFSCWREEDEETWQRNRFKLSEYMTVEPIHPEPTEEERREMDECKAVMLRTGYVEGAVSQEPMSDAEFAAELDAVFPLEGKSHTPPLSLRVIEGGGSDQS